MDLLSLHYTTPYLLLASFPPLEKGFSVGAVMEWMEIRLRILGKEGEGESRSMVVGPNLKHTQNKFGKLTKGFAKKNKRKEGVWTVESS